MWWISDLVHMPCKKYFCPKKTFALIWLRGKVCRTNRLIITASVNAIGEWYRTVAFTQRHWTQGFRSYNILLCREKRDIFQWLKNDACWCVKQKLIILRTSKHTVPNCSFCRCRVWGRADTPCTLARNCLYHEANYQLVLSIVVPWYNRSLWEKRK